jgi:hypothetical protein
VARPIMLFKQLQKMPLELPFNWELSRLKLE